MPAVQERRAELVLAKETRDPFESGTVQSEVPRFRKRVTFASLWISGWYIYLFHTCTHSQFRDAQFVKSASVFLKSPEVERASTSPRIESQRTEICSYSQWCHIIDFSRREKSLMDFQEQENHILKIKKTKKLEARDGKRSASSAMYRLNCPDKTKQLYNGTVIGFSLPRQNAVHMWSNGLNRHLNLHTSL